jgi:hypothetical protein
MDRLIYIHVPLVMLIADFFVNIYLSWRMDKHMLSHKIDFVIINPLLYPSLFMFGGGSRLSFMYIEWSWGDSIVNFGAA